MSDAAVALPADLTGQQALDHLIARGASEGVVVDDRERIVGTVTDTGLRLACMEGRLEQPVTSLAAKPGRAPTTTVRGGKAGGADGGGAAGTGGKSVKGTRGAAGKNATGKGSAGSAGKGSAASKGARRAAADEGSKTDATTTPPAVAVIMAGGRGQRLRPLTDKVPKPLLKVGRSSIVERIIRALVAAGVEEVFLSVNYKAGHFRRRLGDGEQLGVTLHYVQERERMGTAGALSLLPHRPAGPILVTNGDIMTRLDFRRLLEFHAACGGALTMGAVEHVTNVPYGVLRTDGAQLTSVEEKPDLRVRVNAGFYVLDPTTLDLLEPGQALDMPDLIQRAMDDGRAVHVFPVVERWFDIGSPEDFQHVLMEFATGEEE